MFGHIRYQVAGLAVLALLIGACQGSTTTVGGTPAASGSASSAPIAVSLGDISIGALYPLSGANAEASKPSRDAVDLAVEILNGQHPEIDIKPLTVGKIKLIAADTQSNPQVCASEVDRMQAAGAVGLVGSYGSSEGLSCSARAEQVQIPLIASSNSSPALITRGLKWFFHLGPTDETFTQTYFEWLKTIKSAHPVSRITNVYVNTQFGTDAAAAIRKYADQNSITVVDNIAYDPAAADLTSQVQKLRQGNPDAVFYVSTGADAVVFMRTLQQLNYTPPAILSYGAFNLPSVLTALGSLADNVVARAAWSLNLNDTNPLSKQVSDAFTKKTGGQMAENSARDFEGMITMGQAIEKAKSKSPQAIRDALASYSTNKTILPGGGITFGPDGQNQMVRATIEQRIGGKFVQLYPTAAAQVVWPMPPLR